MNIFLLDKYAGCIFVLLLKVMPCHGELRCACEHCCLWRQLRPPDGPRATRPPPRDPQESPAHSHQLLHWAKAVTTLCPGHSAPPGPPWQVVRGDTPSPSLLHHFPCIHTSWMDEYVLAKKSQWTLIKYYFFLFIQTQESRKILCGLRKAHKPSVALVGSAAHTTRTQPGSPRHC